MDASELKKKFLATNTLGEVKPFIREYLSLGRDLSGEYHFDEGDAKEIQGMGYQVQIHYIFGVSKHDVKDGLLYDDEREFKDEFNLKETVKSSLENIAGQGNVRFFEENHFLLSGKRTENSW